MKCKIKPCPGTILGDLPFLTLFLDRFTPGTSEIVAVDLSKSCDLLSFVPVAGAYNIKGNRCTLRTRSKKTLISINQIMYRRFQVSDFIQ